MFRSVKALLTAVALAAGSAAPAPAQDLEVDLELVLAVDVSGSMDTQEHRLQRTGYVDALAHPEIWNAIESGALQRIAVTYFEWAGPGSQRIVMPWQLVDSAEAAREFSQTLSRIPISDIRGTSISGAIDFAAPLFRDNGFTSYRQVVDISGDGPNNRGRPVLLARAEALAQGITINGLPIMLRSRFGAWSPLDDYYADCVVGGPNAFVLPVTEAAELTRAIRRKLMLEIALAPLPPLPPQVRVVPVQGRERSDCMVGERQRRYFIDP